jgi:hypothetical protein
MTTPVQGVTTGPPILSSNYRRFAEKCLMPFELCARCRRLPSSGESTLVSIKILRLRSALLNNAAQFQMAWEKP